MASINFLLKDLEDQGFDMALLEILVPKIGMEIEKNDDNEVVIDITPNRPDLMDFTGFVRALNALAPSIEGKKQSRAIRKNIYEIKNRALANLHIDKKTKKIRPFISMIIAKNVNLKNNRLQYLLNFSEKLSDTLGRKRKKFAVGMYDFDKITPDLFYNAVHDAKFAPLGNGTEMSISEILDKHEKGIKYKSIFDSINGRGSLFPILKDSERILSLVPIVNSEYAKVTENTKSILLDITGTSEQGVQQAMNIFICSFIDSGSEVYPVNVYYDNKTNIMPTLEHRQIKINAKKACKKLGINISSNDAARLLEMMGYSTEVNNGSIIAHIPEFRSDIFNSQDVIEDIAIAYGYDNITAKPIEGNFESSVDKIRERTNEISTFMIGLGFSEVVNTYLTNEKLNFENMQINVLDKKNTVTILNAKTEAITMLRTDLLPGILNNLGASLTEKMPQKLFEVGSVFSLENSNKVHEQLRLAFASEHAKANFSEIKAYIDSLLKLMGIEDITFKEEKSSMFIEGRCAIAMSGNKKIGIFGELHPKVLNAFRLEEPTVAAEITIHEKIEYQFSI